MSPLIWCFSWWWFGPIYERLNTLMKDFGIDWLLKIVRIFSVDCLWRNLELDIGHLLLGCELLPLLHSLRSWIRVVGNNCVYCNQCSLKRQVPGQHHLSHHMSEAILSTVRFLPSWLRFRSIPLFSPQHSKIHNISSSLFILSSRRINFLSSMVIYTLPVHINNHVPHVNLPDLSVVLPGLVNTTPEPKWSTPWPQNLQDFSHLQRGGTTGTGLQSITGLAWERHKNIHTYGQFTVNN